MSESVVFSKQQAQRIWAAVRKMEQSGRQETGYERKRPVTTSEESVYLYNTSGNEIIPPYGACVVDRSNNFGDGVKPYELTSNGSVVAVRSPLFDDLDPYTVVLFNGSKPISPKQFGKAQTGRTVIVSYKGPTTNIPAGTGGAPSANARSPVVGTGTFASLHGDINSDDPYDRFVLRHWDRIERKSDGTLEENLGYRNLSIPLVRIIAEIQKFNNFEGGGESESTPPGDVLPTPFYGGQVPVNSEANTQLTRYCLAERIFIDESPIFALVTVKKDDIDSSNIRLVTGRLVYTDNYYPFFGRGNLDQTGRFVSVRFDYDADKYFEPGQDEKTFRCVAGSRSKLSASYPIDSDESLAIDFKYFEFSCIDAPVPFTCDDVKACLEDDPTEIRVINQVVCEGGDAEYPYDEFTPCLTFRRGLKIDDQSCEGLDPGEEEECTVIDLDLTVLGRTQPEDPCDSEATPGSAIEACLFNKIRFKGNLSVNYAQEETESQPIEDRCEIIVEGQTNLAVSGFSVVEDQSPGETEIECEENCGSVNSLNFADDFRVAFDGKSATVSLEGEEPEESPFTVFKELTIQRDECGRLVDATASGFSVSTIKTCSGKQIITSITEVTAIDGGVTIEEVEGGDPCKLLVTNEEFCNGGSTYSELTDELIFRRGLIVESGGENVSTVNLDLTILGAAIPGSPCCDTSQAIYKWNANTNEWDLEQPCPSGCTSQAPSTPGTVDGEPLVVPCTGIPGNPVIANQFTSVRFDGNLTVGVSNDSCEVTVTGVTLIPVIGVYPNSEDPCPEEECNDASELEFTDDFDLSHSQGRVTVRISDDGESPKESLVPQSITLKTDCTGKLVSGSATIHKIETQGMCSGNRIVSEHDLTPSETFNITVEVDSELPCGCDCGEGEDPPELETIDVLVDSPFINSAGNLEFPRKKVCVLTCSQTPESAILELEECPDDEPPAEPETLKQSEINLSDLVHLVERLQQRVIELEERLNG